MDRLVSTFFGADGPRAADVVGLRDQRVVAALAVDAADGVDRREVEHVEAHGRDGGQAGFDIPEGSVPAGLGRRRPREQFVPGAEIRPFAFGQERQVDRVPGFQAAVGKARSQFGQRLVERQCLERMRVALGRLGSGFDFMSPVFQRLSMGARGALRGAGNLDRADLCRNADVVRVDSARHLVAPRGERIDPGHHGVDIGADGRGRELGFPHVVDERLHGHFVRVGVGLVGRAPAQHDARHVVAVGEAVGGDAHRVARHALDREAAAVDIRQHRVDDGAHAAVVAVGRRGSRSCRGHWGRGGLRRPRGCCRRGRSGWHSLGGACLGYGRGCFRYRGRLTSGFLGCGRGFGRLGHGACVPGSGWKEGAG